MILCANPACDLRPRPASTSQRQSAPQLAKRSLQSRQVCRLMSNSLAMASSDFPSALRRMIWQRLTRPSPENTFSSCDTHCKTEQCEDESLLTRTLYVIIIFRY